MTNLAEEAVEWLMRLEEDDSNACRTVFHAWFNQSPRHVQEFLQATEMTRMLRGMDEERRIDVNSIIAEARSNVVEMQGTVQNPLPHKRRRNLLLGAAAVLMLAVGLGFWSFSQPQTFETAVGEQRMLKLPDGSILVLNTRSRVQVKFNDHARDVRLIDGEALFTVARDSTRPFRVLTADATVQALGTQFDVHRSAHGTRVAVIEGTVQVSAPRVTARKLSAGEETQVSAANKFETHALPDLTAALAWRERRLEFHDAPLAEVAAEFNRYNTRQIRIEGSIDPDKRITGIFNADNPEALIRFLEKDRSIQIGREKNAITLRRLAQPGSARPAPAS